jgi:hypothetical protein
MTASICCRLAAGRRDLFSVISQVDARGNGNLPIATDLSTSGGSSIEREGSRQRGVVMASHYYYEVS